MKIIDLVHGELLAVPADAHRLQVMFGRVWLTERGAAQDVFAASGECIDLAGRRQVLVEGLGFARVALLAAAASPSRPGRAAALRRLLLRWRHAPQRMPRTA